MYHGGDIVMRDFLKKNVHMNQARSLFVSIFLKNCQIFIRECEELQLKRMYLKRFFISFQHIPREKERCCKCFVLSEAHSFLIDGFQRKSSRRPCIVQKAEHD